MQKYYDIAVVFGGRSSENEVSVITGTMVSNVLKKGDKSVLPIYVAHDGKAYADEALADIVVFKKAGYDKFPVCAIANGGVTLYKKNGKPSKHIPVRCVLNCCHGGDLEGGALAGAAALADLPFASAGIPESAVFMDKYLTKLVLQSLGVRVAKYAYARSAEAAREGAAKIGYPVLVKPVSLGSSIGIAKAEDDEQLEKAFETAFALDSGVLIEEYLSPKREINCAAYLTGGEIVLSELEEVSSSGELLSYDDKYSGGGERKFPAEIDGKAERAIKVICRTVYDSLNMRGIVRFDFILISGENGRVKIYLSEVNTVPGSLSQYLLSDGYKNFYKVLISAVEQAQKDFKEKKNKKIITTGILNNINTNACKVK